MARNTRGRPETAGAEEAGRRAEEAGRVSPGGSLGRVPPRACRQSPASPHFDFRLWPPAL